MSQINEWTLTADIAKWIEAILRAHVELPFSRAEVEETRKGSRKRRDLTLYDRKDKPIITGELKMPDSPDGRTPFQDGLVEDAHDKADSIGVEYFFTWNVNRCVLWKTFEPGTPIANRSIQHWYVVPSPVRKSDEIVHPQVQEQIKQFLEVFLARCAAIIVTGAEPMPSIPLDEKFLLVWESALEQPVAFTLQALSDLYQTDKSFTKDLDEWMRDQDWVLSHTNDELVRENLERAAKFSCYVLANKVIFYKALRRRFTRMRALRVSNDVAVPGELRTYLDECFQHAKAVSQDYETVFSEDFADSLPFLAPSAVDTWRELIHQTDGFDFTKLDYEIIGQVFERMLSGGERHKFGQHYTRSEVVDLINAFCIRSPNASVMDPACGGGTFLVRAYTRKRDLSGGTLKHDEIIRHLFGLDISAYPAHLTTINLATRDLIDRANYPLVARKDFFDVSPGKPIFQVPIGRDDGQMSMLQIENVDAVVGNPPYVRQEKITEYYGKKYKTHLREQALRDAPGSSLSGRSDIHCYFFTHGFPFLNEGGYMGLLTSSTWLDTTYGFRLQEFLLDNFEIVAVFESDCEPWFTGARVTTAATILRRQKDPAKRAANTVKFVSLSKPLAELLTYAASEDDRRLTFEGLRNRIEGMAGSEELHASLSGTQPITIRQEHLEGMRVRIVNQGDLHQLGCAGPAVSEADEESDAEEEADTAPASAYTGYKWGIFLRAPDVFFNLLNRCQGRFIPLGSGIVATVKRGVTSGCDTFFFPQDITDYCLAKLPDPAAFKDAYGVSRQTTDRIRVVRAGDGSIHLIEKEYLQPVVFNLMEVDSAVVKPERLKKQILTVSAPKDELRGTHVLKYIRWGEREGFDDRPSCGGRELWYGLPFPRPSDAVWSKSFRYRHICAHNVDGLPCNCNLYDVWAAEGVSAQLLCAVLNSTLVALSKHQFGRMMGGDPMLKTEVVDVKMMLVPDPRRASDDVAVRLNGALDSMSRREIGHLVAVDEIGEEPSGDLAMPDRQELDDAVLELIGISDPEERRSMRAELYTQITRMYRAIRAAEKRMQEFRSRAKTGARPNARHIANEIWESLEEKPLHRTIADFASVGDTDEVDLPEGKARVVSADLWNEPSVQIGSRRIPMGNEARARFAKSLSDSGIHGIVRVPKSVETCRDALTSYEEHTHVLLGQLSDWAAAYTSDEAMQDRIVKELLRLIRNGSSGSA